MREIKKIEKIETFYECSCGGTMDHTALYTRIGGEKNYEIKCKSCNNTGYVEKIPETIETEESFIFLKKI